MILLPRSPSTASRPITTGIFTADLTLGEGTRFITAVASDPLGNTATANISVTIDTTPPRVIISTPAEGTTVFSSPITVTGMINDIVSGTVNGNNATVTVNGISAIVSNRGFTAQGITLSSGANTITVIGTDTAGNQAQATITVTLDISAQAKIVSLSGDNQTGPIGSPLSSPLVVQLRNSLGTPIFNQPVTFTVTRNNGTLNTGQRTVTTNTDPFGKAEVTLTLGTYAGAGENRVEVTSSGFAGPVLFTATGSAGVAAGIHQVNESVFRGATNTALPQPLEVIVNDSGGNPIQGVPVDFTVVAGGGKVDNNPAVTVISNSDGKAHVTWILGPDEGITNNRVEATFSENTGLPVTFVASGVISGDPANTTFSGIVFTNTDQPIPGVTVSIEGTTLTTQTDLQGQFQLTGVPVGALHLLIDPSTTTLPGKWPELMFEVNTIAGRDNTVGMPILLLPLQGGEPISPTQGATLAVDNVAGFTLTIPPGTVTFPDGTSSGTVSVTQVHRDKVPMPPPNGLNPKIVFTIQPAGAIFDPPAPISFPNVDGRVPGEIMNLYSFDHDLGQWVSIGTGSVTEDGAFIVSDPGVGIIEGGWHVPEPEEPKETDVIGDIDCGVAKPLTEGDVQASIDEALDFLSGIDTDPKLKAVMELTQGKVAVRATLRSEVIRTCPNATARTVGCFDGSASIVLAKDAAAIQEGRGQLINFLLHELFHSAAKEARVFFQTNGFWPGIGGNPGRDGDEDGIVDSIDPDSNKATGEDTAVVGDPLGAKVGDGAAYQFASEHNPVCQK